MTENSTVPWVCAQIGSREHYAIPRAVHARGELKLLLTDYWSPTPSSVAALAPGSDAAKAAQRFHPDLASIPVEHLGMRRLVFEIIARLSRTGGWQTIMRRNAMFQRVMLSRLRSRWEPELRDNPGIFFTYSYAALELMRWFRSIGWRTVLGQIDPGIREEEIVAEELRRHPNIGSRWKRAPAEYWRLWREECAAADHIAVNSEWSREALVATGIPVGKVGILPLAFEKKSERQSRTIPAEGFTKARPLRVLFLGQLTIRKGVHLALEAARALQDEPVEWTFVGPGDMDLPADLRNHAAIRWHGPVSREATAQIYREADVFLLPTLSDGFALTQLEAQAQGLPILASKFCGSVVRDGENGWIIDPLNGEAIVASVQRLLQQPASLKKAADASRVDACFSMEALAGNVRGIQDRLMQT